MAANERRLHVLYRITGKEQKAIEDYQAAHPTLKYLLGRHMGTDHDHASGLIRGRLDWRINKAYGLIEDIPNLPAVLRALADYHESPPAVAVLGRRYGLMGLAKYKKEMLYGPPPGHKDPDLKRRPKRKGKTCSIPQELPSLSISESVTAQRSKRKRSR
jgi:hypothetical protein